MEPTLLESLQAWMTTFPYRPVFVTVSGAHLYGFPSPDSDVDLRGAHLLPWVQTVGLKAIADMERVNEFLLKVRRWGVEWR